MRTKAITFFFLALILAKINTFAQDSSNKGGEFNYMPVTSGDYVQDKNFYFFTLLEQLDETRGVIEKDPFFESILQGQLESIRRETEACSLKVACHIAIYKLSDLSIEAIGSRFREKYAQDSVIQKLVATHLSASGYYKKYDGGQADDLLVKAWEDAARGINNIIDVYGLGGDQRYPAIDSVSYEVGGQYYSRVIVSLSNILAEDVDNYTIFFQPSLDFALQLLQMNDRDEAGRFEPMVALENKLAYAAIGTTNWADYPYSVILVPGHGPEEAHLPISPFGKLRCRLASERYQKGWAPFIIVSGGYVHPAHTLYNESFEMKKELMNKYKIPESAIIIEPHARHTTTNFRNAARIIYRYGIPFDKMAVATTTMYQSYYISDMHLDDRSTKELGYVPFQLYKRLSKFDIEFKPRPISLHMDCLDPLDP